jgi:hypothetical protein
MRSVRWSSFALVKTLPRRFLRRNLAHRLAKPCVPRVRSEPRVPDQQEMKWTQFLWRFHEPQGGILFHHLPHAIGQCEWRNDGLRRWGRKRTSAILSISDSFYMDRAAIRISSRNQVCAGSALSR